MAFIPPQYTLADLTVSRTGESRGLSNQPATDAHRTNLELLTKFLQELPFPVRINSAYRSPTVNAAVGGAKASQHMEGLALDLTPQGLTNKEMATWLWAHRAAYPELDQVIWYTDTSHVHIGICPPGAIGCVRGAPRAQFYTARKEGSDYTRWVPDEAGMSAVLANYVQTRPVRTAATVVGTAVFVGLSAIASVGLLAWLIRRRRAG